MSRRVIADKVTDMMSDWAKKDKEAQQEAVTRLGLPENNTATDRAKAMGFSDETHYHGTNSDIDAFDPQKTAMGNIWFAENPKMTDSYTSNVSQGAGNVIPLKVRKGNVAGWNEYEKLGLGELETRGYDSTWLPSKDGQSSGFVLDPSKLRSPLAHFNPKYAGVGAGSVLSADLMADELDLEYKGQEPSTWDSLMNTIGNVNQQQAQSYGDTGAETMEGTANIAHLLATDPAVAGEVIGGGALSLAGATAPWIKGFGAGLLLDSGEASASPKYSDEDFIKKLEGR